MNKKINFRPFFFLAWYFLGITSYSYSQSSGVYDKAIAEAHRILDSLRVAQKIPGLDAAVSVNGVTVWSEAFGFADLEKQSPVIPGKTRFRIGSVSKPLTSAALGRLMDMKKTDINQPVQTYVPYFPVKKYPVSVKQAGGHIAGIRHYRNGEFLLRERYNTVRSGLDIFMNDSLLFEPGSRYLYSSYGFNLLSAVIEGSSGENFLTFIHREVFSKLGMTSTCADKNDSIILNRTSFYDLDSLGNIINAYYVDNSYKWAGGGFISTTADLIRFGEAHIKPGFLSAETLGELTTSQSLKDGKSTGYGIGWVSLTNNRLKGYGHSGGSIGGITDFRIFPEEKIIIVLLSNSSVTKYGNITNRLVNLFLEAGKK